MNFFEVIADNNLCTINLDRISLIEVHGGNQTQVRIDGRSLIVNLPYKEFVEILRKLS